MSVSLHISNLVSVLLPNRGGFWIRRNLFRLSGIRMAHGVRVATGVRFYDHYAEVGSDTWIGMDTRIVSCSKGWVRIGARVDIAPMCILDSGTHEKGGSDRRAGTGSGMEILIGDGCWVGLGARILPGASIGAGSIVAAGAVVRAGKYPQNTLIGGVPARVIKELSE